MQQMAHYASLGSDTFSLSAVCGVFQSDTVLTPALSAALRGAVAPLEAVPPEQLDWHPGSDGQVLDLVHPSLYPLVYGATRRVAEPLPRGIHTLQPFLGCGEPVSAAPKPYWDRDSSRICDNVTYGALHMTAPDGSALNVGDLVLRGRHDDEWQIDLNLTGADRPRQQVSVCRRCCCSP